MVQRRIYIKGLSKEIDESSLVSRFKSFGIVSNVDIAREGFGEERTMCRGFAHLNLESDEASWRKCLSLLNGSNWKGQKVHIEEAKGDLRERFEVEKLAKVQVKEKPRRALVRHASDMSLVNEQNVDKRKGWRRGQFGRPILILKLRKPNGQLVVMDPSHHKEALTKFYTGNRQKPLSQLSWFYEASGAQTQSETLGEEPEDDNSDNDGHSTQSEFTIFPEVTETIDFKEEPANKQGWEEVVCGTTFSLASLLNLPAVSVGGNPETKTKLPEVTETTPPVIAFDVSKLFYNFSSVIGEPECAENLFIPKASRVESLTIWKTDRSEIRKDFKKQAKEAKRLVRRKQNISNPRLVA